MPGRISQVILPGSELEARPIEDRRAKLVARVAEVFPHGTAFRYNLVYYGLEPGEYDLRDALRRKDGSSTADLPRIPVTIQPILPPGQVEPHNLEPRRTAFRGMYRFWVGVIGFVWIAGLVAILIVGRKNKPSDVDESERLGPTLADRLRPLVERARAGTLNMADRAELERMLIGYWSRELGLESASPAEAMAAMRADERAGPLLRSLEGWLHRPDPDTSADIPALLEPYGRLPAETAAGAAP
jgi:hypothetical protein